MIQQLIEWHTGSMRIPKAAEIGATKPHLGECLDEIECLQIENKEMDTQLEKLFSEY